MKQLHRGVLRQHLAEVAGELAVNLRQFRDLLQQLPFLCVVPRSHLLVLREHHVHLGEENICGFAHQVVERWGLRESSTGAAGAGAGSTAGDGGSGNGGGRCRALVDGLGADHQLHVGLSQD